MELAAKVTLAEKGQEEALPAVKQALATLKWTAPVDLDIMAAIEYDDGTSDLVCFKNMGDLNSSPFMKLDKDAGVGATGGDNEENLRIAKIPENVKAVRLLVLNYSDAVEKKNVVFGEYDGAVVLTLDNGDDYAIPLMSEEPGHVCCIGTIHGGTFPKLVSENFTISLEEAAATIPGFSQLG